MVSGRAIFLRESIKLVIVTVAIPSLMMVLLNRFVFIDRSFIINVDMAIIALAAGLAGVWMTAALAFLIVCAGVLVVSADIYFFNPWAFLRAARFLPELLANLSPVQALLAAGLGAVIVGYAFLCSSVARSARVWHALLPFAIIASALAVDSYNGLSTFYNFGRGTTLFDQKLAGSFGSRLVQMKPGPAGSLAINPDPAIRSATAGIAGGHDGNIVLIVVESWGRPRNAAAHDAVIAELNRLKDRYDIREGVVPFSGGTTFGELRELCNVVVDYKQIGSAADCLPQRLAAQGFRVSAYHGFSRRMFDRESWWPRIGLGSGHFAQALATEGLRQDCGAVFKGICDLDIAAMLGDKLARSRDREFVYWLTLNTHLPVPADLSRGTGFDCRPVGLNEGSDACALVGLLKQTFDGIARLAARPDLPPTEFLLVGDHAPPFASPGQRAYFEAGVVPFLHLVPRNS